ncbi:hypothetical protein H8L32_21585 [Undibacterium sp. CY18W]|uniref:Uncharacterized protein n=1 Tax=Undibacterium hunanense TaxID=2762292 RepID=A0ABR6ZW23_9BURK|nr:hypothetical protein [Undibacterium hunanense]MBC3920074.1 hypothetical protein [Undibacterium hunanense]
MNPKQIAELGVARLGLPIPMAKLVTIQSIAVALRNKQTEEIYSDALIDWAGSRRLESECLEALCPLLITKPKPALATRMQKAIKYPSLASNLLLSIATNKPIYRTNWKECHSGLVPELLGLTEQESVLRAGFVIPLSFTDKLEELQEISGLPFIRQWAYEYKLLSEKMGIRIDEHQADGYLAYFLDSGREDVGQFVALQGHLARSAYLRTLACAKDVWNMPDEESYFYAQATFPAEPAFLMLVPQAFPDWAQDVHNQSATLASNAMALASAVVQRIEEAEQAKLMHCSLSVINEPQFHAELEVFSFIKLADNIKPGKVINFYRNLLGKVFPLQTNNRSFISRKISRDVTRPLGFAPLITPLIGQEVGYLQTEFLCRLSYMPLSTNSIPALELVGQQDKAILRSGGQNVGTWKWWRWNWKPSHPKGWPSPTACCTYLQPAVVQKMANDLGGSFERVWVLTTWHRQKEYGEWERSERVGNLTE